eukprot:524284-Pyramimonas_sp.AAC.1
MLSALTHAHHPRSHQSARARIESGGAQMASFKWLKLRHTPEPPQFYNLKKGEPTRGQPTWWAGCSAAWGVIWDR